MHCTVSSIRRALERRRCEAPNTQPVRLARTFVETGDERCPIAGIWSRLIENDQPTDDPELSRPVAGIFLPWRAFIPV